LNAWNFNQDRGPANFDMKHSWTTSGVYELPFGRGRRFLAGMSPLGNKLLGGWQIDGIFVVQSGLPFAVGQQQGLLSSGTGNLPNRIARVISSLLYNTPMRQIQLAMKLSF
jgi:hypothetical protein